MARMKVIFFYTFLCAAITGCSRNATPSSDTAAAAITSHPGRAGKISSHSGNGLYSLLGLSIGCSEDDVTALYGEPDGRYYEIVGTYGLTDQSLYTHMIYDDKTIVIRDYLDQSEKYNDQNGVIEMEIRNGNFKTTKGIQIGDSVHDIRKKYKNARICSYGEKDGLISSLIFNRAEKKDTYKKRDYPYEYGKIDKVAYILSQKKYDDHCNIPALIFLIYKENVTRIIVMNTVQQ